MKKMMKRDFRKTYESAKLPYLEPGASLLLTGFYFYKDVAVLKAIQGVPKRTTP